MANLSSNPWSFTPSDVVTTAVTSLTLNADGTVTAVVGATAAFAAGNDVTIAGNTSVSGLYNRLYSILVVVNGTTATLVPSRAIPAGTGAAGATGNMILTNYPNEVRIEDISWQSAAGSVLAAADVLTIFDREGNLLWSAVVPTAPSSFSQNRGKLFWVNGIAIQAMGHGVVLVTVN